MKNLLIALFSLYLFVGCFPTCKKENNTEQSIHTKQLFQLDERLFVRIIIIDSCEYFYINGGSVLLTHKGNCKNPIHKH